MRFKHIASTLICAGTFSCVLLIAACGSGSASINIDGTDCTRPSVRDTNGCAYVALSDAPGDFLTYTVNVTKLELQRADGTSVSVLPNSTTVDFAQYQDLGEFLSLNSTPPGTYVSGVIGLDYSNADIEVEGSTGNAVTLTPVDANGNPVTAMDLTVDLDPLHPLILLPGIPKLLNVDFNLDASNIVNTSNDTVTVEPFLIASVNPATGKELRVRGPLNSVDTASGSFILGLRPFEALAGNYGKFAVYTTASTKFLINQRAFEGSAGIAALQAAGTTTAVVAQGKFDFNDYHLIADTVEAGSSVPGGTLDTVEGVVTARSGSIITMRGTTLYRTGQSVIYRDSVKVTLGTGTQVREIDSPLTLGTITDISVGQHLLVFGKLTNTNPLSLQLDATGGFALMEFTKVDGSILTVGGSSLTMDVKAIQGRKISLFDFTGTGSDPLNYDIAFTNGLASGIGVGDPVRGIGFVSGFGLAPPDFDAHTLVDYSNAGAFIGLAWADPGTAAAFTTLDASSGIVPNLASSPILHRLRQGGIATDLNSLPTTPTIKGTLIGLYAILQNGKVQVYLSFPNFIQAVQSQLGAGAKVRGCFALGGFDNTTDVMTSDAIAIILQ
ncbi:MAG: hypothetical protein ACM3ZT_01130 [Bacillota bacterium]